MYAVIGGLNGDYNRSAEGHMYVPCGRHICSGPYASNEEYMYTSASGHSVECIEFIWGTYTDIVVSYLHKK